MSVYKLVGFCNGDFYFLKRSPQNGGVLNKQPAASVQVSFLPIESMINRLNTIYNKCNTNFFSIGQNSHYRHVCFVRLFKLWLGCYHVGSVININTSAEVGHIWVYF